MLQGMDKKIAQALLVHLTAQTEYLAIISRYYATLDERLLVRAVPARVLREIRDLDSGLADLAERMSETKSIRSTPADTA